MKTNTTMERRDGRNLWLQSAVGLFLLTLLAICPLQALGQGVIGANTANVYLNDLFLPPTNIVTVSSGVTINNSGPGNTIAVAGSNYMWTVINDAGSINGKKIGVGLAAGGVVDNRTNGIIAGGDYGVAFSHNNASVINNGTITGTNKDGVGMEYGGIVDNQSGTIQGQNYGVEIGNFPGSVTNAGTITGFNKDGVYLSADGSVNNLSGGNILGDNNGVRIEGTNGVVVNAGTISGGTHGVLLKAGGTVDNQQGGMILGGDAGVRIEGGLGSVTNRGTIIGTNNNGVHMLAGGSVENRWGGTIQGGNYGVHVEGGAGYVFNRGTISGTNKDGVYMDSGGTVDNQRHGTISGGNNGVEITNGAGYVSNDRGTITGQTNDGVRLWNSGTVDNGYRGGIYGNSNGVHISGSIPITTTVIEDGGIYTVHNSGKIIGTNGDGVLLENNGTVYNGQHGTILGGQYGVEISAPIFTKGELSTLDGKSLVGGSYTVDNYGTITGQNRDGVRLRDGGTVYNGSGGDIYGNIDGVHISSSIAQVSLTKSDGAIYTVDNYGTIRGTNRTGVLLENGGGVYNGRHGTISGGQYGVDISTPVQNLVFTTLGGGSYTVYNSGSISGYDRDGVRLRDGGSVYNGRYADIYGFLHGVHISGGPGMVVNAGSIVGVGGTAILLDPGLFSNMVTLETGSYVQGNIVGGAGFDAAILQGHGSYGNSFLNFETLTVQASGYRGWNLTGTNMFTTNATVQTGLLRVNGELDTPLLTVSNYAGLGGTGTIFGIVDNHGYFAPGNSIGSVTIIGSMTNWGDYNVQIDAAGNSDHIAVSDTATIMGGTVVAQPVERKIYSNTVYTILTATNGVNGTYDTSRIEYSFWPYTNLFLSSWLSYDENNAYLNLHRAKFTSVANTYNQTAVAGALDGIVDSPGPGMSNLVCEFFWLPSAPDARKALDSMSGEIHGTLGMLDMQQQDAFNRSVSLRTGRISSGGEGGGYASMMPLQLADAGSTLPPMPPKANQSWDIWMQGFGSFGHLDGDGNASGGRFNISGMNGGVDYRLRPELLVGLAMGYSYDDASVGGPGADGNVNAIQIAGYGGYVNGPWHLDGILSYGFLSTDTKRYISVGSIHEMATANYDGGVLSLSAEGGYAYEASSRVTIEPTLGLIYTHVEQDSFSEKGIATDGNNYGLNVRSVDMDSFRTALGVRLDAKLGKKDGVQFIPELRVGWEHEFADRTADVTARFIGGSGDFIVRGVELGADSAALGAGLTVAFSKAIQGAVNYDARLNEQLTSHAISGRMSYSW